MERTLFSPSMLEAFTACKRAYLLAYSGEGEAGRAAGARALCKKFILRGLGQINKGAITNASQLQKFMGQYWPIDKLSDQPGGKDSATRAFLYAYKTLASLRSQSLQARPVRKFGCCWPQIALASY